MGTSPPKPEDLLLHRTEKFYVLGRKGDNPFLSSRKSENTNLSIFLDINEEYTRNTILKALQATAPGCRVTLGPGDGMEAVPLPEGCTFQWSEYERIDWSAVLSGKHCASSYCVRKGLSRKAQLAHYTKLHICKNPNSLLKHTMPKTVILDTWPVWEDGCSSHDGLADIVMGASRTDSSTVNRRDRLDKCLAEAKQIMTEAELSYDRIATNNPNAPPPVWILKPSTINKGAGIQIIHLYEQLVDICWEESDIREWVLQEYVSPPLLLRKRKFHIRAYALAVSAIRVYLFKECLALCSGTNYNEADTSNTFAHITNTAHQDLDPNFVEEQCVRLWSEEDVGRILVRDGTCRNRAEAKERVQHVFRQMELITEELFRAYRNEFGVFSPIEGCFEHYGLDFVVRSDWSVFLLEVNPGPDFKQTGSRLSKVIETLMSGTVSVALCGHIDSDDLSLVYESEEQAKGKKAISMTLA